MLAKNLITDFIGLPFSLERGGHKYPKIPGQYFCDPIGQKKFLWPPPIQELIFLWPPFEKKSKLQLLILVCISHLAWNSWLSHRNVFFLVPKCPRMIENKWFIAWSPWYRVQPRGYSTFILVWVYCPQGLKKGLRERTAVIKGLKELISCPIWGSWNWN